MRQVKALLGILLLWLCAPALFAGGPTYLTEDGFIEPNYTIPPGDIVAARYIEDKQLKQVNEERGQAQPPQPALEGDKIIHGPHALAINVIDTATGKPVPTYHVQTAIVLFQQTESKIANLNEDPKIAKLEQKPWRVATCIGQLESQEVKDPAGACRYEGLGAMDLEVQIEAKGYVQGWRFIKVPAGDSPVTIRLTPSAGLKGQLVSSATGEPLAGVEVALYPAGQRASAEEFSLPVDTDHRVRTGEDGRFQLNEALPPGRYEVVVTEAFGSLSDLEQDVAEKAKDRLRGLDGTRRLEELARLKAEALARPIPLPLQRHPVDLTKKGAATTDLGTIKIDVAPTIELELVGANKQPLSDYPFELEYLDRGREDRMDWDRPRGHTGPDGKARLSLVGWPRGARVALFVPGKMEDTYQVKAINGEAPPIYSQMDSKVDEEATAEWRGRPEHPNYKIIKPEPNKVLPVKLVYRPTPGEVNLRLRFRDAATSQPLTGACGLIEEDGPGLSNVSGLLQADDPVALSQSPLMHSGSQGQAFRVTDPTGRVFVSNVQFSGNFLKHERELEQLRRKRPDEAALAGATNHLGLAIVAKAPGYASRLFAIPLERARAGEELALDLEPEARVQGRCVLAETGEPLTSATLKALLQRTGRWRQVQMGRDNWVDPPVRLTVTLQDWWLTPKTSLIDNPRYSEQFRMTPDANGCFELAGLRPHDRWNLTLTAEANNKNLIPSVSRRSLQLKPGVNDLGEIRVATAGQFTGHVTDAQGQALPGALITFASGLCKDSDATTKTTATGDYQIDLRTLMTERQLVRVIPPWGLKDPRYPSPSEATIMFDALRTLDPGSSNTLNARLVRGHALDIEIPPSPLRDELARYHNERCKLIMDEPGKRDRQYDCALAGVSLQGLTPDANGFVYIQQQAPNRDGLRFTTGQALRLRVENVPPGRHALRLDAGYYDVTPGNNHNISRLYQDADIPFAFTEFEMPDTSTTLTVSPGPGEVEVDLAGRPQKINWSQVEVLALLDREQPTSTYHGGPFRRSLNHAEFFGTADALVMPMFGDFRFFTERPGGKKESVYRPALWRGLLPGTYRLHLYISPQHATALGARPCYETRLEVPADGKRVEVSIPWATIMKADEQ